MAANDELSLVFQALADPTRRAIITRLHAGPATVGELAEPFHVSRPAVSQHLAVLERAGLIERTVNAQWRTCTLRTEPLDHASDWVERHRTEWNERFDLLEERLRRLTGSANEGPHIEELREPKGKGDVPDRDR